jgi:hypothetical protein
MRAPCGEVTEEESAVIEPAELSGPRRQAGVSPGLAHAHSHRLRPLEGKPVGTLVVHEIYRSLQGESTFAGLPCVFVRLTACHLRCGYCDTPHAFQQGVALPLDEVVARALDLEDNLVEVTGESRSSRTRSSP